MDNGQKTEKYSVEIRQVIRPGVESLQKEADVDESATASSSATSGQRGGTAWAAVGKAQVYHGLSPLHAFLLRRLLNDVAIAPLLSAKEMKVIRQKATLEDAIKAEADMLYVKYFTTRHRDDLNGCSFCYRNYTEEPSLWMGHLREDASGRTACPMLRKQVCPMCSGTGDSAHTRSRCPVKQHRADAIERKRQERGHRQKRCYRNNGGEPANRKITVKP